MSVYYMEKKEMIKSGITFVILVNLKHIYLYISPIYFLYLLRVYCLAEKRVGYKVKRVAELGVSVIIVFGVSLMGFSSKEQLRQIMHRLFPV